MFITNFVKGLGISIIDNPITDGIKAIAEKGKQAEEAKKAKKLAKLEKELAKLNK